MVLGIPFMDCPLPLLLPQEPARDPNLPEGNADETQYAEGEHPGQGPRHISRFVSAVAVGRNCKQHTGRKMNWKESAHACRGG